MDNNKKLFEELLKADGINPAKASESERIAFAKILDQQLKSKQSSPTRRPDIWRVFMKSKITKLAVAAAIIIAAVISITFLNKSATPAWAIEQTIEVLENIRAVKMIGKITQWTGGVGEVTIWAMPDANGNRSECARMDSGGQILIATPKATYRYWPGINKVRVERVGSFTINPWLGKDFFENIRNKTANWKQSYYTDPNNGVTYAVVDCNIPNEHKSLQFVFDIETKLPVSFRQRENIERYDVKEIEFSQIEYNPELPMGIFDFTIPKNATVVVYTDDPNKGIDITGMSHEDACKKIVAEYIQAVIDGNWTTVDILRSSGGEVIPWEKLYTQKTPITAIIKIDEPRRETDVNIGIITPVTVKLANGIERTISYIIAFNDYGRQQRCVIIGTWGSVKEF